MTINNYTTIVPFCYNWYWSVASYLLTYKFSVLGANRGPIDNHCIIGETKLIILNGFGVHNEA